MLTLPRRLAALCFVGFALTSTPALFAADPAELILPYVLTGNGHETRLLLHNQHIHRAAAVTVLARFSGEETILQTLSLAPKSSQIVEVGERARGAGSIVIESTGGALTASARIEKKADGKAVILRAVNRQRIGGTAFATAVWSPDAGSDAEIAIHNASTSTQTADVVVASGARSAKVATLSLAPRETRLVDLTSALHRAGVQPDDGGSYGLRIESSGRPGDVLAAGALRNAGARLWNPIALTDLGHGEHDRRLRTQYVFFGAPPAEYGFPTGASLRSTCVIYNPTASAVTVHPTLKLIPDGGSDAVRLRTMTLAAGTTGIIDFDRLRTGGLIPADASHGALELAYEGDGRIVASLASVDAAKKDRTNIFRAMSGHLPQKMTADFWESHATANTVLVVSNAGSAADHITLEIGSTGGATVNVEADLAAGEIRRWNFADLRREGKLSPGMTRGWFAVRATSGVKAKLYAERLLLNGSAFVENETSARTRLTTHSGTYQPPEGDEPVVDDGSTVRVQEVVADAVEPAYEEGNSPSITVPLDVIVYWSDGTSSGGSGATLTSDSPHLSVDSHSLSVTVNGEGDGEVWDGGVEVKIIDDCMTPIIVKTVITFSIRYSAYVYSGIIRYTFYDQCLWQATCTGSCGTSGYVSVKVSGYEQCFDPGQPYLQCSDLLISGRTCFRKMMCLNTPVPGYCS